MILAIVLFCVTSAKAETIDVKYLGQVNLNSYKCPDIEQDEDVKRICFDASRSHLIVKLGSTYYNYCNVPHDIFVEWISSESLYKYYKKSIITNRSEGRVDYVCPLGEGWLNKKKVKIKYLGEFDLSTFECPKLKSDKIINRICYHAQSKFLAVLINRSYYAYCDIGHNVYKSWTSASVLEDYYKNNIKVDSNGGLYDCRGKEIPEF